MIIKYDSCRMCNKEMHCDVRKAGSSYDDANPKILISFKIQTGLRGNHFSGKSTLKHALVNDVLNI